MTTKDALESLAPAPVPAMSQTPTHPQSQSQPQAQGQQAEPLQWSARDYPRLSMSTPSRLLLASLAAFSTGALLGAAHGGKNAQLRFRAEHAHKMPTATTDWYFYHRTKNYHAAYGGLREGLEMGGKLGFWAFAVVWLEHSVDRYRGRADMFSTVIASLTVSGGFSLWNRFPLTTAARTTKQALAFGFFFGGLQDALALARGQSVGYVDFIMRRPRPEQSQS